MRSGHELLPWFTSLKLTKKELIDRLTASHKIDRQNVMSWLGAMMEHRCSTCSNSSRQSLSQQ
jgi:nucleoid DNA-binding protein